MDELFQPKKFPHLPAGKISRKVIGRASLAFWAGLFCFSLAGCAANGSRGEVKDTAAAPIGLSPEQCAARAEIHAAASADGHYLIQPGDQLDIGFYLNSEFNDSATVRPDGKITLGVVGDVQASGLTPAGLADELNRDYARELRSPGAVVHVKNMPGQVVYVDGQVGKPGAIPLQPGMTALQVIANAGGLTPDAGRQAVLIRRDACGSPEGSKLDLDVAAQDPSKGEDVALMPRDILLVPRSGIANVDLWMKQHVRDLLPVQTFAPLPL